MKKSPIVVLSFMLMIPIIPDVFAASSATNNECWGDIANQMGQLGAMGVHSAASSPFNPTPDDPRIGVANANTTEDGEPGDGGIGNHAIRVGGFVGGNLTDNDGNIIEEDLLCDGTPGTDVIP